MARAQYIVPCAALRGGTFHFALLCPFPFPPPTTLGKGRAGADHLNELLRDFAPVANLCASRLGL